MAREFKIQTPRRGGKTTFAIKQLVDYAVNNPNSRVAYVGPVEAYVGSGYELAKREAIKLAPFGLTTKGSWPPNIKFNNGSKILFPTPSSKAMYGYNLDMATIDDAGYVSSELIKRTREAVKDNGVIYYTDTLPEKESPTKIAVSNKVLRLWK